LEETVPRANDMILRGKLAAETTERIVTATETLLAEQPLGTINLRAIADRAGMTVQTVLAARHWREDMALAISSAIEAAVAPPKLAAVGRSKPERVTR
jgi:hypothetical protein